MPQMDSSSISAAPRGFSKKAWRYGRYLGVDNCEQSILLAQSKCDQLDAFRVG